MSGNFWDELMGDDEHAAEYMLTYGEGPGFALRHRIGDLLKTEEKVLDVGCGPGWNFEHFMEYGPSIYYRGIDYSERFVKVASERVHPMEIFKVGDARNIAEPDDSFDVVILQDCLEHTNGYEKPVQEALRVARRLVIITFWHLDYTDNPHINDDGNDGWGAWYDKKDWETFLGTLEYPWQHEELKIGERTRDLYTIEKDNGK